MKNIEPLIEEIREGRWDHLLEPAHAAELHDTGREAIRSILEALTATPVRFTHRVSGELFRVYFTAAWLRAFEGIGLCTGDPHVLEVASGSTDPVPQALAIHTSGSGSYVSANLNRRLTGELRKKTAGLDIDIRVIEKNAADLRGDLPEGSFSMVAFQHAVNDILQTIIAERERIDTVGRDWFEILGPMVAGVTRRFRRGQLREAAGGDFLHIMGVCAALLEPGGYLVFNHHVFQVDLDHGYPPELYHNLIPLAREWIGDSGLELREVRMGDFDPRWWLFLRKP